jgi:putative FmdB family regulatory protein
MPIYAYRCTSCGFEKDHLQKLNDPALLTCPQCHQDSYRKQLTAAGFLLKGEGWYATDFKNRKTAEKTAPGKTTPEKAELPEGCRCCPGAHTCAGN